MEEFKVQFEVTIYKNGSRSIGMIGGIVKDRYLGIKSIDHHTVASGKGGTIDLNNHKMNVDFYLILGDDGETYRIECNNVKILPPTK